jgi:ABC-type nickel/cobalt efflux system permease component RcnA
MTTAGWIFMISSLSLVLALAAFCFWRVLARPSRAEHLHAPQTIETGDEET